MKGLLIILISLYSVIGNGQFEDGFELKNEVLYVYCPNIKDWSDFNSRSFASVRILSISNLEDNDSLNVNLFESVTELELVNSKSSSSLVLSRIFPRLKKLRVLSNQWSNISYEGIHELSELKELDISDKYFERTFKVSELRRLEVLSIGDNTSLEFMKDNLSEIISGNLDFIQISTCNSNVVNSFLKKYFDFFRCRKLWVSNVERLELIDNYNFDVLITDRCPILKGNTVKGKKRIIILKTWVSLKKEMKSFKELSSGYNTSVVLTVGLKGCVDSHNTDNIAGRLRFYVLGDKVLLNCKKFQHERITREELNSMLL